MNLLEKFNGVQDFFSPRVIGEVNDVYVKIARIKGDKIPWHNHDKEDELFYIVEGSLMFEEEGKDPFIMHHGDIYIVKRGINHKISSVEECKIMLIENKSTAHTGNVKTDITRSVDEQLKL